ncbi:MAG: DIP1984 family protein [Thermoguttaceae bacterium]|nr:DIP1984 family protein [Thermoguttaceae bacterium]
MKLAEALVLKSDLRKRIDQLRARLVRNAKVQEGDTPGEQPEELLSELDRVLSQYETLTNQIIVANQTTRVDSGTLADLLVRKEQLARKLDFYEQMLSAVGFDKQFFFRRESSPAKLSEQIEQFNVQLEQIDTVIQKYNWCVEL